MAYFNSAFLPPIIINTLDKHETSTSTMDASSNNSLDQEVFGPLVDISEESLVLLASSIRERVFHTPTSDGKQIARIAGAYNIVHIIQLDGNKLVIRIPATGWGSGKTETAARALESQVATLRLIKQNTAIPVPEVYDFDTTDNNAIGAPYICMSFVPGIPVMQVWFKDPETMSREQFRLNILSGLSHVMAQFSRLTFDKIGSVSGDEAGNTSLEPCYDWHINDDGTVQIVPSGPFDSASAYFEAHFKGNVANDGPNEWDKAESEIMQSIMSYSPIHDSQGGFVLRPPDLNPQNVMVDEQGNITGLIDWDLVQTLPRCVGYARYPGWITRDWDPLMYGWPHMADSEDSPEDLERYRAYYNKELGKALNWQGDWKFTNKSHITEAVWIATLSRMNRLEICQKMVQTALKVDSEAALDVVFDIGAGYYKKKEWDMLDIKLRQLVSLSTEIDEPLTHLDVGDQVDSRPL